MECRMSEPVVEDLINFTFSPTDNATIGVHKNPIQLYQNSNLGHDFNIDLNQTFDLNKCEEHIKASSEIGTVLDPFKKYEFDCTNQKKNAPVKLSQRESLDRLESDDSLGILPDLLKDEMTTDLFRTELGFSDNETLDDIIPELNESPASFVFSPPSDKQFNRISLFLKNISTPLPNFGNDRRCSSTPKISVASQFLANAADIEHYSSPQFLPDEKEEPIAGSCHIKFETDFNLDDLKNVKPLTSTYKTFPPNQLPSVLYELDEETDLISEVSFKKHVTFENNLNVTQTFSHVGDLNPCRREDSIQAVDILNNTFQIKQPVFVDSPDAVVSLKGSFPSNVRTRQLELNNCNEREKVQGLNSTFAIPKDTSFNVDCEKTFLIDFNSVGTEASSKSFYKDMRLNETRVLDIDSSEFSSKQQEQIGNVTFVKDLENDTQASLEKCCSSLSSEFKPMTKILEETFSKNNLKPILEETFCENDLNEMLDHSKNVLQYVNRKSQSASHETGNIKANVTFSEKVEMFTGTRATQNENYLQEPATDYSPKALTNVTFQSEARKNNCFHDQINLAEIENDSSNKLSLSVSLHSKRDATFSQEVNVRDDQEFRKFHESDSTENINSITENASPKSLKTVASTSFNKEMGGKSCKYDQIILDENDISNNMLLSSALKPIRNATFSEENNETVDQNIDKLYENDSDKNISSIIELSSPKALASATFNEEVGGKYFLHNQIDCAENEYNLANKMSNSDPLQSITDTIFYETNKKSNIVSDELYKRDSIQVESSSELASSLLPKISKSLAFYEGSKVADILESSVFQDSNDLIENVDLNSQTVFSRNTAYSLNLNQANNSQAGLNFPKSTEESIFTGNASEETEFCTRSISEEDCPFAIMPTMHSDSIASFSEKTDKVQGDINTISNENDQVQPSPNSLKERTSATFSEKIGEFQIEQIFVPTENDEFDVSPNSQKEINAPFSALAEKDMRVQPEMQISRSDQDSLGETGSSNLSKLCLTNSISREATNSVKNCLLESKTVVKKKKGLIKPTQIVLPRKVSEQRNGQMAIMKPFCKPIIDKRSSTSDFNNTLNLCDNSTDKSNSKNFNRRLTLSCSSESDTYKPKCKTDFKKSFGIPSKLGLKRPGLNFKQSRLDVKFSNGDLKGINSVNDKQNLPSQPEPVSCKEPKKVKPVAVTSVNAKGPFSSRLSLHGKLPLMSLNKKECELKSNTALANAAEKRNNVISCPKVIDQPEKEKNPENEINNANSRKNYARHSIAAMPRKILPFNNIPNNTSNSKPTVIKQKSAPALNSCNPDSLKPSSSMKLPNSIAKLKFSSLPKVQSHIKIFNRSESKIGVKKRPESGNQNSNGVPEGEAVQFVETLSSGHVKKQDNTRDRPTTSMFPSREQTVLPSNPTNVKKSNSQCKFLPMPKVLRGPIKSVNSNNVRTSQESEQNQVCQQTSRKLPQLQRIPAPRYNKC